MGSKRMIPAPTTTAAAVSSMGRKRTAPASITAASSAMPSCKRNSTKSTRMMEFRTTIPAGMLDGTQGGRAGAAGIAADQHDVGVSFRHASRNCAYAHFSNQLHGDASLRIHIFQVVDQLCEILDRINIVMRWRRDQSNSRNGVPQTGNHFVHLVPGELPTFSGFRALSHLDL